MMLSKTFLLGLLLPLCNGVLLPRPSGEYQVMMTTAELVDESRPDPWDKDTIPNRRIMTTRFDPVRPNSCYRNEKAPYMSPVLAKAEDEILGSYEWPSGVLSTIDMVLCYLQQGDTPMEAPIVLFSPGLNTTRYYYSAVAQEVASRGFSVIAMDHPFETDVVEFPDGTIAYGGNVDTNNTEQLDFAVDIRAKDASFVIDQLAANSTDDLEVVMFGHSFGGAASPAAMMGDTRIRGGVNLDGYMFGPVLENGLNEGQSFVLWGADSHNTTNDKGWGEFWSVVDEQGNWKKELNYESGVHGSFWDLGFVVDTAGIRDELSEKALGLIGTFAGEREITILADYLNDFFRFVLDGADEGLLAGPSKDYPEVSFL
jgi:dienelactone hydrolase